MALLCVSPTFLTGRHCTWIVTTSFTPIPVLSENVSIICCIATSNMCTRLWLSTCSLLDNYYVIGKRKKHLKLPHLSLFSDCGGWSGLSMVSCYPLLYYWVCHYHYLKSCVPGAVLSSKSRSDKQLSEARLKARTIVHAFHKAQDRLDVLEVCIQCTSSHNHNYSFIKCLIQCSPLLACAIEWPLNQGHTFNHTQKERTARGGGSLGMTLFLHHNYMCVYSIRKRTKVWREKWL